MEEYELILSTITEREEGGPPLHYFLLGKPSGEEKEGITDKEQPYLEGLLIAGRTGEPSWNPFWIAYRQGGAEEPSLLARRLDECVAKLGGRGEGTQGEAWQECFARLTRADEYLLGLVRDQREGGEKLSLIITLLLQEYWTIVISERGTRRASLGERSQGRE